MVPWAVSLLKELQWAGVADVEFMIDPRDGTPKLMEINPRFWSSLYLALECGVDFPWLLVQTALMKRSNPSLVTKKGLKGDPFFQMISSITW
jgi:predicted ATP-grasp superfamily ATP-dependent carboligase